MVRVTLFFYSILFPLLFGLYFPVYLLKLRKRGNFKRGFGERFGIFSKEKKEKLKSMGHPIWIHAVSVGEAIAAVNFVREWSTLDPEKNFVLSTTTSTGQHIAQTCSSDRVLSIYFPLDIFLCVRNTLQTISPSLIVLFEVEIWPNLIVQAHKKGVKLSLVNCRMSDNSLSGYLKFRWFFENIFNRFSIICTQSEIDATRIRSIVDDGGPCITVCNTMKFDQVFQCHNKDVSQIVRMIFGDSKKTVFAAASTHPGEELVIARIVKSLAREVPKLCTILIPRHVERISEIEKILEREGLKSVLLSDLRERLSDVNKKKGGEGGGQKFHQGNSPILLINTTGEMMDFLAVADIVFMGNSLAGNRGGHNIIEPAILGKPIIFGLGMENFRIVVEKFKENEACLQVEDEVTFEIALRNLLRDPEELRRLGKRSLQTVEKNKGAIRKTISNLQKL